MQMVKHIKTTIKTLNRNENLTNEHTKKYIKNWNDVFAAFCDLLQILLIEKYFANRT